MKSGNKYFCFNVREFAVLLSAYEIKCLPCFKYDSFLSDCAQNDYNIGIFDLYKNGTVEQENGKLKVKSEIRSIFMILKEAKYYTTIICKNKEVPEYLLYFSHSENFVVAQPGTHTDEYVKLQLYKYEDLGVFLDECGALLPESIAESMLVEQDFIPAEDEEMDFLKVDMKLEEKKLLQLKNVETVMTTVNCISLQKEVVIGILKQILQDKIIWWKSNEKCMYLYSKNKIVELLKTVLEEKENDIS